MREQEEDESSSTAESPEKSELSFNMKDLSECIPCGGIATVSMTKHLVEETGCEMWTVDKASFRSRDYNMRWRCPKPDFTCFIFQHCCSQACTRGCDKSKDGNDGFLEVSTKSSLDTVSSRIAKLLPLGKAG